MPAACADDKLTAAEATYVPVVTPDGKPMNAQRDYAIRMTKDELPPAGTFWSLTLYDMKNGFFIPNDRKKYSVGENAGMQLNDEGGIEIHIAAEKPEGVPEENWLPINRKDEDLDIFLRARSYHSHKREIRLRVLTHNLGILLRQYHVVYRAGRTSFL